MVALPLLSLMEVNMADNSPHNRSFLLVGTPVSGFKLVGPFDNLREACVWASINNLEDWFPIAAMLPDELIPDEE